MPDSNPDWFFQPRRQTAAPPEDSGDGLISLPAELLQRHGARVLSPDTAVTVDASRGGVNLADQLAQQQGQRIQPTPLFRHRQILRMHHAAEIVEQHAGQQLVVEARFVQHNVLRKAPLQQTQFGQAVRRHRVVLAQHLGQQRVECGGTRVFGAFFA